MAPSDPQPALAVDLALFSLSMTIQENELLGKTDALTGETPDALGMQREEINETHRERKTLQLTIKKHWFDMIVSGKKKEEYRRSSKWILCRLYGRYYSHVRFRNGYSIESPTVLCEYLGWYYGYGRPEWGGGSTPGNPLVVIKLGDIYHSPKTSR